MRIRSWWWILAGALLAPAGVAMAQDYPSRLIRIIVAFPPGASTDIYARIVANELQQAWGKSAIVENRAGGTGVIGTQFVRQAAPDGYVLLFTSNTGHVLGPLLMDPRPFDPVADFTSVSMAVRFPLYLIVNPSLPVRNVSEFVAYAKSKPKVLNYASSGQGGQSHITAEVFNSAVGIEAMHLPYKGAAPAQQAVMAGEAQYRFDNIGVSHPFVLAGKLRGLAITGVRRMPAAPDVPTFAESGISGLEGLYTWLGMFGPPQLPPAIVNKLSAELIRIMRLPEVGKRAMSDGYEVVASAPARFTSDIQSEVTISSRIIREKGIKAE
jgi:tripartite-type tricarboxylate transporter receptor subunit TctC